jgi:hypothetical protein
MTVLTILFSVAFFSSLEAIYELGSYERVETINNVGFKQKLFFDNDETMADFFVNGEVVDKNTFRQKKYEAYDAEVINAQQRLKIQGEEEARSIEQMNVQAYVKLMKQIREKLEILLHKIYEDQLKFYWKFDEETVSSEEVLYKVKNNLLPSLAFVEDSDVSLESIVLLRKMFKAQEKLYNLLSRFYQNTVAQALEQADDPVALKKLLELNE